ncbi:GAF domain-containing protein [Amorphus orientalis]|uniref:GAF domain-containing protein n=1 Tax=Amorphus orientalis TaxID=649198 RepID=A0AAE4AR94_9HYPH|nr:GAF domain-containing protein [Amorphus orientalis]MDQ0314951.1 GAF domain-containing protein [Amorphus orientalis]
MTLQDYDPLVLSERLADALATPGQPVPTFQTADQIAAEYLGHRLFTILAFRAEAGEVERIYSSRPAEYPLLGRKKMGPTPWGDVVLKGGKPWFGASADDIRWAFPDHELILSLGCETILNAPVRFDGRTLGVISVLDAPQAYDASDLALVQFLAPALVPALLHSDSTHQET